MNGRWCDADRAVPAVEGVCSARAEPLDAWARGAWSILAEPSDRVAGSLIAALGAWPALRWALDGRPDESTAAMSGASAGALRKALDRWRPRWGADTERTWAMARRAHLRVVVPGDEEWPPGLEDLGPHAPYCLWIRGAVRPARGSVSIVGARAATSYGEFVAGEISADLARRGVTIVSGAAYGIDGAAHRAALAAGGQTVAVLAGGVDRPYPRGHSELLARICAHGAVVAEVPPGTAPTRWRFLQRNRLIAAMAGAVVVVEAGARSGSLNTAGHAATLGRPLGAVPGPVTSAASTGCHALLREFDASCVTSAEDVVELLGWSPHEESAGERRLPMEHVRVLDALTTRTWKTVHDIAAATGLSIDETRSVLGLLALEGTAQSGEFGWRAARP